MRTNFIRYLYENIYRNPFELNELTMVSSTTVTFSSQIAAQVRTRGAESTKRLAYASRKHQKVVGKASLGRPKIYEVFI